MKIIQTEPEEDRKKGRERNEQNLIDLWDNIKWFNM